MSSANSSAPADAGAPPIVDAFIRVAEVSCCAYAEPCDAIRLAELEGALAESSGGAADWLRGYIRFSGDCHGHLTLHVPAAVAADLVRAFLGLTPDDPLTETELLDGFGEFGNMVCGAWLTEAARMLGFTLSPPIVIHEAPGWSPVKALEAVDVEGFAYALTVNDQPAVVRVSLEFDV
ncbi:MAG TPA: chemotaxis protein CheX [Vicinamibacterales bacterium]